jgi:hypothetical protein
MSRFGRGLRLALGAWASAVFLLLWAGAIAAVAGNGALSSTLWEGLGGLDGVMLLAAWVLFLPVGVGLWAANAELSLPVAILVIIGLGTWTAAAWGSLARTLGDRRT